MAIVLISLFSIITIGLLVGAIRVRGIALGTAAVFFVALIAGHLQIKLPGEITELGLALFVYSVGLQAGPRFFSLLKARGGAFLIVAMALTIAGAGMAILLARVLKLSAPLAAGMYCGAGTCTPALAGVLDAIRRLDPSGVDAASVGYAASYPFSVLAIVLTVQWLPKLLRTSSKAARAEYQAEQAARNPPLKECAFRVTNPNCDGMSITEIHSLHVTRAVIGRIKHEGQISAARPEAKLKMGDVVLAVGTADELAKLEHVLGEVASESLYDPAGNIDSELIVVSHRLAVGRTLRDIQLWERFGVVATRIRRNEIEMSPHGDLVLELGDVLRLVGAREDMQAAIEEIGKQERRLDETSFIPFAAGLAIGAAVGLIRIPFPGGVDARLGISGGVLLVALILGRLGHMGPMRLYVPNAAKQFASELGLVMFLSGAGTGAGRVLMPVLREAGPALPLAGAAVTVAMIAAATLMMFWKYKWNVLYGAGGLSACMTNPSGLAVANQMSDTDAAAVGFASVYPIALLSKIILATGVYFWLRG